MKCNVEVVNIFFRFRLKELYNLACVLAGNPSGKKMLAVGASVCRKCCRFNLTIIFCRFVVKYNCATKGFRPYKFKNNPFFYVLK